MASEISNVNHSPAVIASLGKSTGHQASAAPKVMDIKPTEIQFDPAQARRNLHAAVSMLNEQMSATKQGLGFSFDDSKNMAVIRVRNLSTGEEVRQIPTEDVLRMAHKIDDLKGILYNKAV
jgi:flagellar protein FlaG